MTDKKEEQKTTTEETPLEEKKVEEKKEEVSIPKASELKPGMTIRVFQKIKELNLKKEEKERIQYFEGIIIAKKHNSEIGGTITVRRSVNGIGVEKIFPLNLPTITNIEIKKQARVKRAKLYFLKKGYKKKLKETKVA
jgi:large subunit ribosomal protein L19